jgi:hypothetical protein
MFGHISHEVIPDRVSVPIGAAEQVLDPIRVGFAEEFGELPAILAFGVAEQATEVAQRALAWFGADEVVPNALANGFDLFSPLFDIVLGWSS